VPYSAFAGVSIFGLLPGRVYSEVNRFQIILHCPQPGATGAAWLVLPFEGPKSLRRRSRTKVLTSCRPVLRRIAMLVTLSTHPMPSAILSDIYYSYRPNIYIVYLHVVFCSLYCGVHNLFVFFCVCACSDNAFPPKQLLVFML